jgi:uncharacterized protein
MPRVVHFELNAKDPGRASAFYEIVFGWKFQKWNGPMDYWLITTGPDGQMGINGGMAKDRPPQAPAMTIGVGDLDACLKKIVAGGGRITQPKTAIPGVGWLACFIDTEGNSMGLLQPDMSAK